MPRSANSKTRQQTGDHTTWTASVGMEGIDTKLSEFWMFSHVKTPYAHQGEGIFLRSAYWLYEKSFFLGTHLKTKRSSQWRILPPPIGWNLKPIFGECMYFHLQKERGSISAMAPPLTVCSKVLQPSGIEFGGLCQSRWDTGKVLLWIPISGYKLNVNVEIWTTDTCSLSVYLFKIYRNMSHSFLSYLLVYIFETSS